MIFDGALKETTKLIWRGGDPTLSTRLVAEEKAIALTFNGSTLAVMMATPVDLEDFGIGFALGEGIIGQPGEITGLEILGNDLGIEVRMWLESSRAEFVASRRRAIVGPVGCGLCGMESLEQACPKPPQVASDAKFHARDLLEAIRALPPLQELNQKSRAMHAAAAWLPAVGIAAVREDVGRHNALDKLAGALIRDRVACADGAVLLTSRVSVEMVQKTARIGAPVIVAVSAPTTLAIRTADQAGITLLAVAREDGYEVFTHPDRLIFSGSRRLAA